MKGLLCSVVNLFIIAVLVRIVLSWFPSSSDGFVGQLSRILNLVTEPVLGPVRRVVPPLRIGAVGLDMSVMIVVFGLRLIMGYVLGC